MSTASSTFTNSLIQRDTYACVYNYSSNQLISGIIEPDQLERLERHLAPDCYVTSHLVRRRSKGVTHTICCLDGMQKMKKTSGRRFQILMLSGKFVSNRSGLECVCLPDGDEIRVERRWSHSVAGSTTAHRMLRLEYFCGGPGGERYTIGVYGAESVRGLALSIRHNGSASHPLHKDIKVCTLRAQRGANAQDDNKVNAACADRGLVEETQGLVAQAVQQKMTRKRRSVGVPDPMES